MKHSTQTCGCCEGIETVTPEPTANRPGLSALSYRIGTHATFFESLLARLSSNDYPKLAELTVRNTSDPSIALLDASAVLADVLTFYNERILNEAYLATATERRSILELARLVGYKLRPGVAASVYLAYTMDSNATDEVLIPKGSRSQSIPGPGELPQSFETSEALKAKAKWNNLRPRITQPQTPASIAQGDGFNKRIYLKGTSTNLKPNSPLLISYTGYGYPIFDRVKEVKPDAAANRTLVVLQSKAGQIGAGNGTGQAQASLGFIEALNLAPSIQPANALRLTNDVKTQFLGNVQRQRAKTQVLSQSQTFNLESGISSNMQYIDTPNAGASGGVDPLTFRRQTLAGGEASHSMVKAFAPAIKQTLAPAASNAVVTEDSPIKVYALRTTAELFGHNNPGTPIYTPSKTGMITVTGYTPPTINTVWPAWLTGASSNTVIAIEPSDEQITPESWLVIERPDLNANCGFIGLTSSVHWINAVRPSTFSGNGVSAKVSLLTLDGDWSSRTLFSCESLLRDTRIYAHSELLELAEEPIEESVCGGTDQLIELDGLYDGLEAGRWVIVNGERELEGTSGIRFSELAMISSVSQNVRTKVRHRQSSAYETGYTTGVEVLAGDKTHTFIKLANKLEYCFKRDTITIYGNVVKATHGETRTEVLGSGDGAKALQTFVLKQPPLTYVSASNPSGVDSTLKIYVNDIAWHESDDWYGLTPTSRSFVTKTDNEDKTSVIFGNGLKGARLPTGTENIKAEYRNGIGKPGNVNAGQISLLSTRPLGTKAVINPLRASGGADKENRDQARKNVPLAVKALDRLVSVQDYQDFARIYAGIGKAHAVELTDGRRQLVYVTIAGADDIPIDKNSDLYRNLYQSLLTYGDPYQALVLEVRELLLMVIEARVRILPDTLWEPVITQVRAALLDAFSFERRELGQDVLLSEVISVMQAVPGVAYVDVDTLRGVPEKIINDEFPGQRRLISPGEIAALISAPLTDANSNEIKEPLPRLAVNLAGFEQGVLRPAQLAFLTPDIPASLILNQIV